MNACKYCLSRALWTILPALALTVYGQPAPAPPAPQDTFNLNLQRIGGGFAVLMQDLFDVIHKLDPQATVRWDPIEAVMHVESEGHRIEVHARQSLVRVNGRDLPAARSVPIRQNNVYIPVETVQIILGELGVEFDLMAGASAADQATTDTTPTVAAPLAIPPASVPLPVVGTEANAPAAATLDTTSSATAPAVVIPHVIDAPATPLPAAAVPGATAFEPPRALAGKIGLSWGQLADLNHRTPPQRLALVFDASQQAVANLVQQQVQALGLAVTLVPAASARRDAAMLVQGVQAVQPELLIDLMFCPPLERSGADPEVMIVWAVHDALWPQDRAPAADAAGAPPYHRHQFQSLALGSLLRTELGRQFTEYTIVYELAPSYLLRRVDAPAAAVIVPLEGPLDPQQEQRLAAAVAAAVSTYVQGMSAVRF